MSEELPWFFAVWLPALAGLAAWRPHPIWGALAVAALAPFALLGPYGGVAGALLSVAAVLGPSAEGRPLRGLAAAVGAAALVLALKQGVAARALPAAWGGVAAAAVLGGAAVAGLLAATALPAPALTRAAALSGLVPLVRALLLFTLPAEGRVGPAEALRAVPLVYASVLATGDASALEALVRAAPQRDEAALALGWERALDLGWRPQRADGAVVAVARALELRGRGGEGLRVLARAPRVGEVDWTRALFEAVLGAPVRWRGGPGPGPSLPGRASIDLHFRHDGAHAVEFTAYEPLLLSLHGRGVAWDAPARLELRVDAAPPVSWNIEVAPDISLGRVERGPHRVDVRVVSGVACDVVVTELRGE